MYNLIVYCMSVYTFIMSLCGSSIVYGYSKEQSNLIYFYWTLFSIVIVIEIINVSHKEFVFMKCIPY